MPNYIYHACVDCGKVRLVQTCYGESRSPRCRPCSKTEANHPQYGITGEDAAHWKGGVTTDNKGYVWIYSPNHPAVSSKGYVKRARLILEKKLGRYLLPGMEPHHKNEIKSDDSPENLEELTHSGHTILHLQNRGFNRSITTRNTQ